MEEDEYELIPLSPIRKMEKRLERIEKTNTSTEMLKELIDVVRTNQQIVDDIVKINSDIIGKINELTTSVNRSIDKMDEFMNRIEVTNEADSSAEPVKNSIPVEPAPVSNDFDKRMDKMEKRINSLLLSSVAKSKLGTKLQKKPMPSQFY